MKTTIIALSLLILVPPVYAAQSTGAVPILAGVAAIADYVPDSVSVKFGTNFTSGSNIKIMIYDDTGALLCTTSPISKSEGNTVSASITGCAALTPGDTYKVAWVGDGYVPMAYGATNWVTSDNTTAGNYATPPSTLPTGASVGVGEPAIAVFNEADERLIGDSDFSNNTAVENNGFKLNRMGWFTAGYVCVTL